MVAPNLRSLQSRNEEGPLGATGNWEVNWKGQWAGKVWKQTWQIGTSLVVAAWGDGALERKCV